MDDKNPRLDAERIAGRTADDLTGRADHDWESTTRVPPLDLPSSPDIYGASGAPPFRASTAAASRTDYEPASTSSTRTERVSTGTAGEGADEDERTRQLRAEIEETRGEMTQTVNAIQERLRPSNIASNAADSVKGAASNAAGTVREAASNAVGSVRAVAGDKARNFVESDPGRYLRDNPAQSAMLAAGIGGLAWMVFGSRRAARRRPLRTVRPSAVRYSRTDDYGLGDSRVQYDAGAEYDRLGSSPARRMATSGGRGTDERSGTDAWSDASGLGEKARSTAGDVQRRAGDTARQARSQVRRAWNDNPLLIGAAAAIVGAIVGAAMPETDRENEWLGETRDTMFEDVQQSVRETVSRVQHVATAAVGLVTDSGAAGDSGQRSASAPAGTNESGEGSFTSSAQPPAWQVPGGSGGVV